MQSKNKYKLNIHLSDRYTSMIYIHIYVQKMELQYIFVQGECIHFIEDKFFYKKLQSKDCYNGLL